MAEPAATSKHAKRRAALDALDFFRILDALADRSQTDYGRDRLLAMTPPWTADEAWAELSGRSDSMEDDFDRIEALTASVQRGEELPLGGVRDLRAALKRAAVPGSRLETDELLNVAQLLTASEKLARHIEKREDSLAPLQPFAEVLPAVPELVKRIESTISVRTGEVVDDASADLNRLRRGIESTNQAMRRKLDDLVRKHAADNVLSESSYSVRDDRFVLAVRATVKNRVRGIIHGSSASGNTVFIEPDELVSIGNDLRRLQEQEAEEVRRILRLLTDGVRDHLDELRGAELCVGLLDSLQARARFAAAVGAMRPAVREGTLRLVDARHPLLVLRKGIGGTVPLNLQLGADEDASESKPRLQASTGLAGGMGETRFAGETHGRAFVITGPNAGGKTVALKTVGLAAAMIHAGLWPPVGDGSVVPPLDEWHVVIGDDQSLEGDLSSFTGHLEKLKTITTSPAPNKLVLVDEIASGTDPDEGGPLAMSFLEMAVQRGWWTLVTTHMGELKAFAHKTDGVRNGSMQFNRDTLSPTYVFQPDLPGSSYALEIASRVGMPKKLVKRARDIAGGTRQRLEDLIEEMSQRLREATEHERELQRALTRAEEKDEKLRARLETIEAKKDEAVTRAAVEAKRILDEANRTIEHTVKRIREEQASKEAILAAKQKVSDQVKALREKEERAKSRQAARKKKQVAERPAASEPARRPRAASPVKPEATPTESSALSGPVEVGDAVLVGEGNTRGEVLALKKDKAQVASGSMKLWIDISDLRKVGRSAPTGHAKTITAPADDGGDRPTRGRYTGGDPAQTELKLLGKRYEEAEKELVGYLEALADQGIPYARIVHGKGTGTLRALVQEHVAGHPLVDDYRFGEPGEGGDGVTIVHLRI